MTVTTATMQSCPCKKGKSSCCQNTGLNASVKHAKKIGQCTMNFLKVSMMERSFCPWKSCQQQWLPFKSLAQQSVWSKKWRIIKSLLLSILSLWNCCKKQLLHPMPSILWLRDISTNVFGLSMAQRADCIKNSYDLNSRHSKSGLFSVRYSIG